MMHQLSVWMQHDQFMEILSILSENGNCKLGNNFYIIQPILIPTILSCSATCPLVRCKNLENSKEVAIICGGYMMNS